MSSKSTRTVQRLVAIAIAPMVASRRPVAFMVLLAAPGVSYGEIVERQTHNLMGLLGLRPPAQEAEAKE